MSFGLFVHKFNVGGKLFDGPTSDPENKLASLAEIKGGVSTSGDTLKKLEDLITALQSTVSSQQSSLASSIAAVQADVDQNEADADAAIAAVQADVDQNELDGDTDRALIRTQFAAADTALVGGASSAGDTLKKLEDLIAALQSDVDQNETDADSAIAAVQADVDQNEADADAAIASNAADIASNLAALNVLNGSGTGSVSAAIATAIANLIDSAPGALDTLNELAAAIGDDANFASTVTNAIAAVQTDVDQNEADGDADRALIRSEFAAADTALVGGASSAGDTLKKLEDLIAALQSDVDQNETDADSAIAAVQADVDQNELDGDTDRALIRTQFAAADTALVGGASSAGDTLKKLEDLIAALQSDVDQNETDADSAIAAVQADVDQNEADADAAIAAVQADVDQNELDGDTDRALIRTQFAAADTALVGGASSAGDTLKKLEDLIAALQSDVDQNETDADSAIAAVQADVDQNEADADAAIAALQSDVSTNATGIASNLAALNVLNGSGTGSVSAAIATAIANLIDSAPGALDTLNELAAAIGDDANFASTVTNAIAAVQTDVDQNEADADAAIAAVQADVDQNEADADAAIAAINSTLSGLGTMSTQDASSVDIDGGTIDGTVIGGSSAAAGSFTTLSASGAVSLSSTLAVSGESSFSSGLFPDSSTATVDLGGMQGTTSSKQASQIVWFEDSNFTDASEGTSLIYPTYDSNGYSQYTYFKDSGFTAPNPSPYNSPLTTTNDPVSVEYYSDTAFTTQIVAPNSGSFSAVILTWDAADYPDAAERTGDGARWDQVYFPNKYNGMNTNTLVWDTANYQARIEFGNSGQAIDSTWHGTAVKLRNNSKACSHVEVTFPANQGLTAAKILADGEFRAGYSSYYSRTISSVSLVSGQTFRFTLGSSVSSSDTGNTPGVIFAAESDIPSLYLELGFEDSSYSPAPQTAAEISAIEMGDYNGTSALQTSSIVLDRVDSSGYNPYYYYRITFSSVPAFTNSLYFYAAVGSQELRYFQDISAKRAMRIKSLGYNSAPTSNGTGDSALYVKSCPVNFSGSHADELFYLDAAGNTVQFTEGGHVFAPRRAMDETEVLAADADLSSLPTLVSSLKECYVFDLSAKAGSPSLGSSSQTQTLVVPVPQAGDVGREVKFVVLGDMSSSNQLTISAGSFTNSSSVSIKGQIDGLDSVILSQPYQVIKLLAIKAQDDAASADITCWKLV